MNGFSRPALRIMRLATAALVIAGLGLAAPVSLALPTMGKTFGFGFGSGVQWSARECYGLSCTTHQGDDGGDGIPFTNSFRSYADQTAPQRELVGLAAFADAANARLGAKVTAGWDGPSSFTVESLGEGMAFAELFDTFTLQAAPGVDPSSIDPNNLTVLLDWSFHGTFGWKTNSVQSGRAVFRLTMHRYPPGGAFSSRSLVREVAGSNQGAIVLRGGQVDISKAFRDINGRPLSIGDSFLLDAWMRVAASRPSSPLPPPSGFWSADFANTAAFTFSVSNPGVLVVSAAQQAAGASPPSAPIPSPSTLALWIAGIFALGLGRLRRGWGAAACPSGRP